MGATWWAKLKGVLAAIVLTVNTVVVFSCMIPLALVKLVLPLPWVRKPCDAALNGLAMQWVSNNGIWEDAVGQTQWVVSGGEGLRRDGWYLVSSNHQSWVDILVLQRVFNRRIPMLKFFIKHELIYVPIMGLAWWALDFPFMKRRGSRSAQQDLLAARKSCEKFRVIPTSVISFLEGTRFTPAKHQQQTSPYAHLLRPKVGGLSMALETMGELFDAMLDVTIVYPDGVPTFTDALCGRMKSVHVEIRQLSIPPEFLPDGEGAGLDRAKLQSWVQALWQAKDAAIDERLRSRRP